MKFSLSKIFLVQEIFSIISDKRKHSYLKTNCDLDLVLREGIQEGTKYNREHNNEQFKFTIELFGVDQ